MANNPAGPALSRPPKPSGVRGGVPAGPVVRKIQRAYPARLKAAGDVVKLIDASVAADLAMLDGIREKLHDLLLKMELWDQDVARLELAPATSLPPR
jgi:hypothetical protein